VKHPLVERIGVGGMGEVFRTADGLAVKRLLPHLARDARFLELFLAEVKVTSLLTHPNIVQVLELYEEEGLWHVAMEYVPGRDLRHLKQLPPGLAAVVAAQAAAALDCAHKARDRQGKRLQLVHRDVSPHNMLVSREGVVKLIDFGVARALEGLPGKVAYLAPEVANGEAPTALSDQFSLGVVLWELMTGRRLYKGPSDAVTLHRATRAQVPPPEVSAALDAVVMRALSVLPAMRYPDCAALARALEDVLLEIDGPASARELAAVIEKPAAS
jgi:serine/threonine-protein kinase